MQYKKYKNLVELNREGISFYIHCMWGNNMDLDRIKKKAERIMKYKVRIFSSPPITIVTAGMPGDSPHFKEKALGFPWATGMVDKDETDNEFLVTIDRRVLDEMREEVIEQLEKAMKEVAIQLYGEDDEICTE